MFQIIKQTLILDIDVEEFRFFFADLLKFNHSGGFVSINGPFKVTPKHLSWI